MNRREFVKSISAIAGAFFVSPLIRPKHEKIKGNSTLRGRVRVCSVGLFGPEGELLCSHRFPHKSLMSGDTLSVTYHADFI